jgi:two-component system, NtrC family, nitrogen regulation sensor histidine kinase NtrY
MTVDSASMTGANADEGRPARRFDWTRAVRTAGYVAVVLAIVSAATTYLILIGLTPLDPTPQVGVAAAWVNGGLIGFLLLLVAWELTNLVLARLRGRAAARLHERIVLLFCAVAVVPAVLLAGIASLTLGQGFESWFSPLSQRIVNSSVAIAQAYTHNQADQLRFDLGAVKAELEKTPSLMIDDPTAFRELLTSSAAAHGLTQIFLVGGDGHLVMPGDDADVRQVPPPVPDVLTQAAADPAQIAIEPPDQIGGLIGITVLGGFDNLFLYAARLIDPQILAALATTDNTISDYRSIQQTQVGIQIAFAILFLGVTVVVLLSAIWLAIGFADRLVVPVRRLITAATEVARGNLAVQVTPRSDDDVGALGVAFNTMTSQLRGQRTALLAANEQIDSRRRFTEAVLAGATAGIVGLDNEGHVTILNRAGVGLLDVTEGEAIGRPILDILPQLARVLEAAHDDARLEHRDQITVPRGGRDRTFNVQVTTERASGQVHGYVVTLDDITDLVSAQRSSAWADVARRIAHEIKNPLTPIQLSAERLKRRFGRAISGDDQVVFDQCTDTIIRQVGDIGRMVDEFSSFARMPKPTMAAGNLSEAIREAVFVVSVPHPEIKFTVQLPEAPLTGRFDARLMGQALANLVKNATEAIGALPAERYGGEISVSARPEGDTIVIDIIDNGIGFPKTNRQRLLEPYVTTREKGTGLGLAIVVKIIEEHGGRVELLDAPAVATGGSGALVRVTLPRIELAADGSEHVASAGLMPTG